MQRAPLSNSLLVKICGVTTVAMALDAVDAGADLVGVVLIPSSSRCVSNATAHAIREALAGKAEAVALVASGVDASAMQCASTFDTVQFHGVETPDELRALCSQLKISRAMKGFSCTPQSAQLWDGCGLTRLVLDAAQGGSGTAFDHAAFAVARATLKTPILLAGGLDPRNVAAAVRALRPEGVDVSSGVESSKGVKDPSLVRAFIHAARNA
ncbi:MAG: phosphoribosylanthranilate isomerase [Phycisphaerales bacterium]|nr:phosphoribosylanthranilate isomerase [Phycisphaerales bacterium]